MLLGLACVSSAQANGGLSVTEGGQATYVYSIGVPPGIAGMEPKLSLVYSGGPGAGPVGTGWSLQGISQIIRCGSADPLDGPKTAVVFGPKDRLCLDGKRLIQTDGNGRELANQLNDSLGLSGTSHREFRSEIDGFSRVRAYGATAGNVNAGPAYFRVWTKAGIINEYGTTTDARVLSTKQNVPGAWLLKKSIDTKGNYVEYEYEQLRLQNGPVFQGASQPDAGAEWRLKAVRYTGTATQSPSHSVVFDYGTGSLPGGGVVVLAEAYHAGSRTVNASAITAINVYGATQRVRRYELGYSNGLNSNRLLLRSIKECTGDAANKCLPPTSFDYSSGGPSFVELPDFNLKTEQLFYPTYSMSTLGDFDGDGRDDILDHFVVIHATYPFKAAPRIYRSSRDQSGRFVEWAEFSAWQATSGFNIDHACNRKLQIDLNGDGLVDFLQLKPQFNYPENFENTYDGIETYFWCAEHRGQSHVAYLNNGDGTFSARSATGLHAQAWNGSPTDTRNRQAGKDWYGDYTASWVFPVEFNGDGRTDLIVKVPGVQRYQAYRSNGDGTFTEITSNLPLSAIGFLTGVATDVDGDGYMDLIGSGPSYFNQFPAGSIVYVKGLDSTGALNTSVVPLSLPYPRRFGSESAGLQLVDLNGDGKQDLINYHVDGDIEDKVVLINTGDGFRQLAAVPGPLAPLDFSSRSNNVSFLDINGDAREDLLHANTIGLWPYRSMPGPSSAIDWATSKTETGIDYTLRVETDGSGTWTTGDFLGIGTQQILLMRKDAESSDPNRLFVRTKAIPADMLVAVKDSNGLVTDIRYGSLASGVRFDASGGSDMERPASVGSDFGSTQTTLGVMSLYENQRPVGAGRTYPIVHLQPASWVVASTLQGNGRSPNEVVATTFAYGGLKASHTGRGLLGFGWMMKRQPYANGQILATITRFHQDPEQFQYLGQPLAEVTEFWAGSRTNLQSEREQMAMVRDAMQPRAVKELVNLYCDATAWPTAHSAIVAEKTTEDQWIQHALSPCKGIGRVRQPFVAQTRDRTFDLNHNNVELSRTIKTNKAIAKDGAGVFYGDMADIEVSTIGPFAGVRHTTTQRSLHTYDYRPEYLDKWWLGRLKTSQITSSVAEGGIVTVSTGQSIWTGQMGPPAPEPSPPLNYTPRPVELPDLLSIITTLLLND